MSEKNKLSGRIPEELDFSRDTDLEERLLKEIKESRCAPLDEDDLAWIAAAGASGAEERRNIAKRLSRDKDTL